MSAIIEEVYDALIDAGASEEKARAAARSIANYDKQFSKIKSDLSKQFSEIRADLLILKWITGLILVVVVFPMLKAVVGL